MSKTVQSLINEAINLASNKSHEYVTAEHLLHAFINDGKAVKVLHDIGADIEGIKTTIEEFISQEKLRREDWDSRAVAPKRGDSFNRVLKRAIAADTVSANGAMTYESIALALASETGTDAYDILDRHHASRQAIEDGMKANSDHATKHSGKKTNGKDAKQFPMLTKFATNLNSEAEAGNIDPVIGRDREITDTVEILSLRRKNNIIYIGDAGIGKTALAEGLALKIFNKEVPEAMQNKVIYNVDLSAMVAGTKFRGEFEERLQKMMDEAVSMEGRCVLFLDEIHTMMGAGAGSSGSMDAANIMKPYLARGKLTIIGTTTDDEYHTHIAKDTAMSRRFHRYDLKEPTAEETKLILQRSAPAYAKFHGISYDDAVIDTCVDLASRYLKNKKFPDKAFDIIDAAGAVTKLAGKTDVDVDTVIEQVARIAKVKKPLITLSDASALENLDKNLKQVIFGQDESINAIVDKIIVSKAGLREEDKTVASLLLTGPTGTGKTLTAQKLAEHLGMHFHRFDMSEFAGPHTVSRLIGSPPGYVGHGDGKNGEGELIQVIESNPSCVLLLDEVEKAHRDVLKVLLQVMDSARLTSNRGKAIDFSNVVLLMTANLGAADAERKMIGFSDAYNEGAVEAEIKKFFAPEFRNRLDAIIKYNKLGQEQMLDIVNVELAKITKKVTESGKAVTYTDAARALMAEKGYSPLNGARPLKKLIEEQVKFPLAKLMLFNKESNAYVVDVKGGKVEVTAKQAKNVLAVA